MNKALFAQVGISIALTCLATDVTASASIRLTAFPPTMRAAQEGPLEGATTVDIATARGETESSGRDGRRRKARRSNGFNRVVARGGWPSYQPLGSRSGFSGRRFAQTLLEPVQRSQYLVIAGGVGGGRQLDSFCPSPLPN